MEEEDRYTRITLRIPKPLHGALDAEADRTSKSLNAEIIGRLSQSFEPRADDAALSAEVDDLRQRVEDGRKAFLALDSMNSMLAGLVIQVYDRLPPNIRDDARIQAPRRLARSLVNRDGPEMASAMADLFEGVDAEAVREMHGMRDEFIADPPPKREIPALQPSQIGDVVAARESAKPVPAKLAPRAKKSPVGRK